MVLLAAPCVSTYYEVGIIHSKNWFSRCLDSAKGYSENVHYEDCIVRRANIGKFLPVLLLGSMDAIRISAFSLPGFPSVDLWNWEDRVVFSFSVQHEWWSGGWGKMDKAWCKESLQWDPPLQRSLHMERLFPRPSLRSHSIWLGHLLRFCLCRWWSRQNYWPHQCHWQPLPLLLFKWSRNMEQHKRGKHVFCLGVIWRVHNPTGIVETWSENH